MPSELAVEMPGGEIELQPYRLDHRRAFQHVELGANHKGIGGAAASPDLARRFRIAQSGCVAHPGQEAASLLSADGREEFLAQFAHRGGVKQHHAILAEPDQAVFRRKLHQAAQILVSRVANPRHSFPPSRDVCSGAAPSMEGR